MKSLVSKIIPVVLMFSMSLIGCGNNKISNERIDTISQANINDLQKYNGSYIGDISADVKIIENLPGNIYRKELALRTDKEPYGITVNYKANEKFGEEDFYNFWNGKDPHKLLEKNAIVFLSLVHNAENIEFNVDNIGEVNYKYNRKDLEKKYGKDLQSLIKDNNSLDNI